MNDASSAIAQTAAVLTGLINFKPVGVPTLPPGVMANFDKVWRNFGVPMNMPFNGLGEFPAINNRNEFLAAIRSTYVRMIATLGRAQALFRNMDQGELGASTLALTLTNDRLPGEPPVSTLPPGIYFGSLFASRSQPGQTEVVVHELSHFKDGHLFSDLFHPTSPNWGKFDGGQGILNAWSYSMFMLDVVFGRTNPFPS